MGTTKGQRADTSDGAAVRSEPIDHACDRRGWTLPADPAAKPTLDLVLGWVGTTITGPWALSQDAAKRACAAVSGLLAGAPRPATVTLRLLHATEVELGVCILIDAGDGTDA